MKHYPQDDEPAVSAVIGAVLIFGIFSSAFIVWSFTTLPVWVSDNEEARNRDVEAEFLTLNNGINLLAAGNSSGPISGSFRMAAAEVPLLQPAPSFGEIYFEDGFDWSMDVTAVGACAPALCDRAVQSGRIVFEPFNYHYEEQDLVWEGGAVLRSQPDGDAIASAPNLDLTASGTTGYLNWTVHDMSGTGDFVGPDPTDVVMTLQDQDLQTITLTGGGTATITFSTTYCGAWHTYLESQVLVEGVTNDASLTVCDASDQATLTLSAGTDVSSWELDMRIYRVNAIVGG